MFPTNQLVHLQQITNQLVRLRQITNPSVHLRQITNQLVRLRQITNSLVRLRQITDQFEALSHINITHFRTGKFDTVKLYPECLTLLNCPLNLSRAKCFYLHKWLNKNTASRCREIRLQRDGIIPLCFYLITHGFPLQKQSKNGIQK